MVAVKEMKLGSFRPGIRARVEAVWVESPSLVWLRPINSIAGSISALLDASPPLTPLPAAKWVSGAAVVGERKGHLRRATILKLVRWSGDNSIRARVAWTDEGGWDWLPVARLFLLPERLRHHPWQAIPARLAGLSPANSAQAWSEEAVEALKKSLNQPGHLYAEAVKTTSASESSFPVATVQLFHRAEGVHGEPSNLILRLYMTQRAHFAFAKEGLSLVRVFAPPNPAGLVCAEPQLLTEAQASAKARCDSATSQSSYATAPDEAEADKQASTSSDEAETSVAPVYVLKTRPSLFNYQNSPSSSLNTIVPISGGRPLGVQVPPVDVDSKASPESPELHRLWMVGVVGPGELHAYVLPPDGDWNQGLDSILEKSSKLAQNMNCFYDKEENRVGLDGEEVFQRLQSGGGSWSSGIFGVCRWEASGGGPWAGNWARAEVVGVEVSGDWARNLAVGGAAERGRSVVVGSAADLLRTILRLRFVDSGGCVYRRLDDVYVLDPSFAAEPALVLSAVLGGVRPIGDDYSAEAAKRTRELVRTDLPVWAKGLRSGSGDFAPTLGARVFGLDFLLPQTGDGFVPVDSASVTSMLVQENLLIPFV